MAFEKPAIKKNLTDDPKLGLTGEPWNEGDFSKKPTLKLRVIDSSGNKNSTVKHATVGVWFTVYLNHPDEDDNAKPINVKMDISIALTFIELIKTAINDVNFSMTGIETKGYTFNAGNKSDKPVNLGTAFVGRNGAGEISIIIKAHNRPTAVFPFAPDFWYSLVDKSGNPVDKAFASKIIAGGWAEGMLNIISGVGQEVFNHKEKALSNSNTQSSNSYENKSSYQKSNPKPQYQAQAKATDVFDSIH